MKKMTLLYCIIFLCFVSGNLRAQLTDQFPAELKKLITATISDIKGRELEHQQVATIYETKLKLSGFNLTYTQSMMGNSLSGKYNLPATQETMDAIFEKLLETIYTTKDSKAQSGMLKGIMNSNVARRIDVLDFSDNGRKVAVFTLYKDNNLLVEILNK